MRRTPAFLALVVVAWCLMGSSVAWAQGYSVYEQSACMTGRGGAGVASPCADGSAVYFNPAGLSFDSTQLGLGASLIGPRGDFTDAASQVATPLNKKWYPVPNFYVSTAFAKKVAVGVGVFAPYGLETDWPETSPGRFLGYKSVVQGLYVQPTVAFKLNDNVSVGAGIDITYLNVELRQRVDLASQTLLVHPVFGTLTFAQLNLICPAAVCGTVRAGTDFANINLKGHAYHAGANLGVIAKANERVSFGARWLVGQRIKVSNGTIETSQILVPGVRVPVSSTVFVPVDQALAGQFATGGKLASGQDATTTLPMPDQVLVGASIRAASNLRLLVDYEFSRWSMFDKLEIIGPANGLGTVGVLESYRNTHGVRVGAEVNMTRSALLRLGFDGHGAAAPPQTVTPNLPEGARQEYTVGLGLNLSPRARLDVGYMYLHQEKRAGRTTTGGAVYPQPVPLSANNGTYAFKANIPTVMLSFQF